MPPLVEVDPAVRSQRAVSLERIQGYESIEDLGGRNGAIIGEVRRVAQRDPEFALEIVRDFEPSLQVNALTVIGKTTRELGPLSDARDRVESEGFEGPEKTRKLVGIAKAAADIDAEFAFETAQAIPHAAPKVDTLLEIAKRSKFIDELNQRNAERSGDDPRDINFSTDLLRAMVRETDRLIESSGTFRNDPYRNRRLTEVSAGFDLGVTYRAEKRSFEFAERTEPIDVETVALHGVQRHIRGYISEGDFEGLQEADPSDEIIIAAFRARVAEYGGEGDRLSRRLGFGNELLDPVTDGAELLRHLDEMRHITFQNPEQQRYQRLYRSLLPIIRDGASAQMAEFDRAEEREREARDAAPALDSTF